MKDPDSSPSSAPRVPRAPAPSSSSTAPVGARRSPTPTEEDRRRQDDHDAEGARDAPPMTLRGAPLTVVLLISLAAIEFFLTLAPPWREWAYDRFAFAVLVDRGDVFATLSWPILTHAALHGGLLHLGFNLAALAIFGPPVERSMGTLNYAAMYLVAAAAGALTHYAWLLGTVELGFAPQAPLTVLVGASGAISGVLAAELLRRSRILALTPPELRRSSPGAYLRSSSITFILLNLAITLLPGFISGEAHIGGFLVGLTLAPIMMRRLSD